MLPDWAVPTKGKSIVLPLVTEAQLRKADDMLSIWAYDLRAKDIEVCDTQRAVLLGKLGDQGPDALMARAYQSGMSSVGAECDALIAKLPKRKQKVLRLCYVSFGSPYESALRLKVTIEAYWAEVRSARLALAAKV